MSKIADNIIREVNKLNKETLTKDEIFSLVRNITKENEVKLIEADGIKLDRTNRTIEVNGKQTRVPNLEFELTAFLIERKGEVVTRELLIRDLWGSNICVTNRTVDVCVCKIRNIIGKEKIQTIKKVGYMFADVN